MELTPAVVAGHVTALADEIVSWARERRVELVTPAEPEKRAGIVSLRPKDGAAVSERLRQAGVVHSFREGAIRLAPHIYNTRDDVRSALVILSS